MQRLVQPIIITSNLLNEIYHLTMKIVSVVIPYEKIHAAKSPAYYSLMDVLTPKCNCSLHNPLVYLLILFTYHRGRLQ